MRRLMQYMRDIISALRYGAADEFDGVDLLDRMAE